MHEVATPLRLRRLEPGELPWANARYAEVDFRPSTRDDLVLVGHVDDQPAALGRITPLGPGFGELGGILVFPAFRGRGLARPLVERLVEEGGLATLFCLPFESLRGLYAACGFRPHPPGAPVPEKVLAKHAWCNAHYAEPVLLLSRTRSSPR